MHMGGRRMGSGPPTLPRSTRSSRSRAGASRKVAALSFDYLAEVAAGELEHKSEMKSDNESGTSVSEAERRKLECLTNQATHEDEKLKAAAAAAANSAPAPAPASDPPTSDPAAAMAEEKKPVEAPEPAPAPESEAAPEEEEERKVKDEDCSSECIEGAERPKSSKRSRKRKVSKASAWSSSSTKRSKRVEFESSPAKAASVATSSGARKGDGLVKVSVRSFTIPELYVDIPESATVGTLKRAVMDAAMNLLGGGLRVCVLLQGRKVPDEAATLSQMGILHGSTADLGFMLEPTSIPSSSSGPDDPLLVLLHAANQPNSRCPAYVMPVEGAWNGTAPGAELFSQQPEAMAASGAGAAAEAGGEEMMMQQDQQEQQEGLKNNNAPQGAEGVQMVMMPLTDNDEQARNESDSTSTLSQATPCKAPPRVFDAKAIILHPGAAAAAAAMAAGGESPEGMALVPMPMRPKGHSALDIHKRRIRRPFSVGEVESLVQAVEHLGTGRWRDVKLQAFENAKHRTYVDLKDKWKTLVHTAQIAPHQRRGDPVPQELLDRVIVANNYWAAHQAKEQQAELLAA